MPWELEVGLLVDKFNQMPFQLGLCAENEMGLLYRSLRALRIFRLAQKYNEGLDAWHSLSADDWRVIAQVREEIKHG